jgi:hypothetical protein
MPLTQEQQISDLYSKVDMLVTAMQKLPAIVKRATLEAVYPVGSPYVSKTDHRNPAVILGFGTWVALEGVTLVGYKAGDTGTVNFGTPGATVGSKTHTLSIAEMPSHGHEVSGGFTTGEGGYVGHTGITTQSFVHNPAAPTGGGQAHNNVQPSTVVYMWERTA